MRDEMAAAGGLLAALHGDPQQLGSGVLGVGIVLALADRGRRRRR
jgi:hypothetical protein